MNNKQTDNEITLRTKTAFDALLDSSDPELDAALQSCRMKTIESVKKPIYVQTRYVVTTGLVCTLVFSCTLAFFMNNDPWNPQLVENEITLLVDETPLHFYEDLTQWY